MEIKTILENLEKEKINSFMDIVDNPEKTFEMFENWCDLNLEEKIDEMKATLKNHFFPVVEEKKDYKEFFSISLKKFAKKFDKKEDINDFSDEEKKEFYDYIDKNWEGEKEKKEVEESVDLEEKYAGKFASVHIMTPMDFFKFQKTHKKIKCKEDSKYINCFMMKTHVATYDKDKHLLYTNLDKDEIFEDINNNEDNKIIENNKEEKKMNRDELFGKTDAMRDIDGNTVKESFENLSEEYVKAYKEVIAENEAKIAEERASLTIADLYDVVVEMKKEIKELKIEEKEETEDKEPVKEESTHDYMIGYVHGYEDFDKGLNEMKVEDRDENDYAIAYRDGWNTAISEKVDEEDEMEATYDNGYAEGFKDAYNANDVAEIKEDEELVEFKKGYEKGLEEGLAKLNEDLEKFNGLVGEDKVKEIAEKLVAERNEEEFVAWMNDIKDLAESDEDKDFIIKFLIEENNRVVEDEELKIEVCEKVEDLETEDKESVKEEYIAFDKKAVCPYCRVEGKIWVMKEDVELEEGKMKYKCEGCGKSMNDLKKVKEDVEENKIDVTKIIEESKKDLKYDTTKDRFDELVASLEVEDEKDLEEAIKTIKDELKEGEVVDEDKDEKSFLTEEEQKLKDRGFELI